MAELVQQSGPLPPEDFTQTLWQRHFLAEQGIIGDTDGSAFGITLPPAGDVAEFGSASIDSIAKVGGYPLIIPAGSTQSLEIPPSLSGGTTGRTDLIVARCDLAGFTSTPGPVRLHRIAGTEGSLTVPAHDPETDLRLWSVRRRQGEALNQAIATSYRSWTAAPIVIEDGIALPTSAPLGMRARRGTTEFVRQLVSGVPTWVDTLAHVGVYQSYVPTFNTGSVSLIEARYRRIGNDIRGKVVVRMLSMPSLFSCTLPVPGRSVTTGWIEPIGTATARSALSSGANVRKGHVIPAASGSLTTVTVVAAGEDGGGQWGPNYPFAWEGGVGGGWLGLNFSYEAA